MKFLTDNDYAQLTGEITKLTAANEALTAEKTQLEEAAKNIVSADAHEAVVQELNTAREELAAVKSELETANAAVEIANTTVETLTGELAELRKTPGAITSAAVGAVVENTDKKDETFVSNSKSFRENLSSVCENLLPILK